jgi:hypothetical protein
MVFVFLALMEVDGRYSGQQEIAPNSETGSA